MMRKHAVLKIIGGNEVSLLTRLKVGTLLLILVSACGQPPGQPIASGTGQPSPTEDLQKTTSGVWSSDCVQFLENDVAMSERKTLTIQARNAVSVAETFVGGACEGEVNRTETFTSLMDVQTVLRANMHDALLEFRAANTFDYAPYRLHLRAKLTSDALITKTVKMSYWEYGQEVWVPAEDLEHLPLTEYRRR